MFLGSSISHLLKTLLCLYVCECSGEALVRASYHKYHIQLGWCLGRSPGCLLGPGIAGAWPHRSLTGTEETKKTEHERLQGCSQGKGARRIMSTIRKTGCITS